MHLTEDWKDKKLKWHKSYYCKNKKGEIVVATLLGEDELYSKELGGTLNQGYWEVLAPVPSYEELSHLETKLEWQDKRIAELKELLKECQLFFEEENPKDFTVISERMEDLLTRINKTIGESEE